jgi:hypothetical protein
MQNLVKKNPKKKEKNLGNRKIGYIFAEPLDG